MHFTVKLFTPGRDLVVSIERLSSLVGPLYLEAWNTRWRKEYGDAPFSLDVQRFSQLWCDNVSRIFVLIRESTGSYEGFLTGIPF